MRILGLDIGSTSVKAVELETAFSRYEVHEYHEQKVMPGSDPVDAARGLINGLSKSPDRIVTALRSSQSTFRNLHFPTRDKKVIQTSIGFELEDELPFPVEDSVYDWSVLPNPGSGTQVHVAASLKRYLESHLGRLLSVDIDPDLVTSEAWAYRTFLNRVLSPEDQKGATLLVQIGHEYTSLYVHHRGAPVVAREIQWGGREITAAIARKYGVADEQAESAKLEHGFVLSDSQRDQATADQIEFSDAILEELHRLMHEIRQAEFTTKNSVRVNLSRIYLSGGTSLMPGLVRRIEEELRIPAEPLRGLSSIATSGITYADVADARFLLAAGLALTQVGSERASAINFRRRAYQKAGRGSAFQIQNLRKPLLGAAAVAGSLLASVIVQGSLIESRMQQVDEQLERSVRGFFGQLSSSAARTYLSNPTTLRNRINGELNRQRAQSRLAGPNEKSPLEFLKGMSQAMPRDLRVDLMRFQLGSAPTASFTESEAQDATLTFWIQSQDSAPRLSQIMAAHLDGLTTEGPVEVTRPDGNKRWRVTFTGKPKESAYGR